jgi:AraC-like DNA-binding protein
MKFEKYQPTEKLRPFVKYLVVSENMDETIYKVLPNMGIVLGFQYAGHLTSVQDGSESSLSAAGVTGLVDSFRQFKNSAGIGSVLIYFTEIGFAAFTATPAHELFNLSVSLDQVFDKKLVAETGEKLALAKTDHVRIHIIEQLLLAQLREIAQDKLIVEAVRLIYQSGGKVKIKELNERLFISQSPFEKRFRKLVGTTPKKFASIVRFNAVLNDLGMAKSLTDICYEHQFFDQAHFIKDFKLFTGDTPDKFKRLF